MGLWGLGLVALAPGLILVSPFVDFYIKIVQPIIDFFTNLF